MTDPRILITLPQNFLGRESAVHIFFDQISAVGDTPNHMVTRVHLTSGEHAEVSLTRESTVDEILKQLRGIGQGSQLAGWK